MCPSVTKSISLKVRLMANDVLSTSSLSSLASPSNTAVMLRAAVQPLHLFQFNLVRSHLLRENVYIGQSDFS